MPFPALNGSAVIQCFPPPHGGKVTVIPKQFQVTIGGQPALRLADIPGSVVAGCPVVPTPAGTKPCTSVVAPPAAWASKTVMVGGQPLLMQMPAPSPATDSVPPGTIMCTFAGQATVMVGS
jgi:hypothetical protein